jgi:hypothetical protein
MSSLSKYVPFIGQIISAGIGYKLTTAFGDRYISEAKDMALELLSEMVVAQN